MRKIAVVGAGFAGLSVCYHLLQRVPCEVTLFDPLGIGGGASSVSTGLLHPFPGRLALRSWLAMEGIAASEALLQVAEKALGCPVALRSGIYRIAVIPAQIKAFKVRSEQNPEALWVGNIQDYIPLAIQAPGLWIPSGMTVFSKLYLEGLAQACFAAGALLEKRNIENLEELKGYDATVLCVGAGALRFPECADWALEPIRGQTLLCRLPSSLPHSLLGLGHISPTEDPRLCQIGSTYERGFVGAEPSAKATRELLDLVSAFYPTARDFEVVEAKTGVRMTVRNEYRPITKQIGPKAWAFTALGSRGLLYHGLLGRKLAEQVVAAIR